MSKILILHASGANRDSEAARACEVAGGQPEIVHINRLRRGEVHFSDFAALLLPGGFTYGDALGAGVRLALDLRVYFREALHEFVASGRPVLGICNGFQTLVKAGVLPEVEAGAPRRVTLTDNADGRFECRWVTLRVERTVRASWLAGMESLIDCPIAHGEGRFLVKDGRDLETLERDGLIAMRYVTCDGDDAAGRYPINPNGSVADIAGICNRGGNVVGLMPHPEDHIVAVQSPNRQRQRLGLPLFQRFVAAARG